jgi:hypothetical protein
MKFRIGILALVSVAFITASLCRSAAETPPPIAKVLVWVRDVHGAPVPGLTADDFAVTENFLLIRFHLRLSPLLNFVYPWRTCPARTALSPPPTSLLHPS